jgi:hypothetical protein
MIDRVMVSSSHQSSKPVERVSSCPTLKALSALTRASRQATNTPERGHVLVGVLQGRRYMGKWPVSHVPQRRCGVYAIRVVVGSYWHCVCAPVPACLAERSKAIERWPDRGWSIFVWPRLATAHVVVVGKASDVMPVRPIMVSVCKKVSRAICGVHKSPRIPILPGDMPVLPSMIVDAI